MIHRFRRPIARLLWAKWLIIGILLVTGISAACGTADDPRLDAGSTEPSPTVEGSTPAAETPQPSPTFIPGTVTPAIPSTSVVPTPPAWTPSAADPFGLKIEVASERVPIDPQFVVATSDLIVSGTVTEVLPPIWTTPDGSRPANPWESVPGEFTIVTPVVVTLDHELVINPNDLDLSSGTVVIAVEGGTIGDDYVITNFPWDQFVLDDRVLVSLATDRFQGQDGLIATETGLAWAAQSTWVLTDDGAEPAEGEVQSGDELFEQLLAASDADEASTPESD